MQLQLLDRVAGCQSHAAYMAQCWERHQQLKAQMTDIANIGGPEQRLSLAGLIASVSLPGATFCCSTSQKMCCPR